MGRTHLRFAAILTLVGSTALAILLPSTGHAPCPSLADCSGAIEDHMALRVVIIGVGVVAAWVLMRRASGLPVEDRRDHAAAGSR